MQFLTSFGGSTTQAQSIINGLQADIYASSTAPDVQLVQDAGLITNDWQNAPDGSTVQSGSVVFAVRPGNPKHIENWNDLTQPGAPGPHARPRAVGRRAVEHRGGVRRGDAR